MKKRFGLFTGIKFGPAASLLYLGENEASFSVLNRKGFLSKGETRQEFRAENFEKLLEQVKDFFRTKPPAGLTIVLNQSFFLERTVFLPFRGRKSVSLVLPGELAPLLPSPLSEYFYDFIIPEAENLPITVFLLPAVVRQSIAAVFPDVPFRILPLDLALSRHPAVTGSENAFLLVKEKDQARLVLFQEGRYILGRSFNFGEADYEERLAEEKRFLLHSGRFPADTEPVPVTPDKKLACNLSSGPLDFTLKKGGQASLAENTSFLYFAVGALVVIGILFFVSLKAKEAASLSYSKVSQELARQKEMLQIDGASLTPLLSDKNVALLLREDLSPLETFRRFNDAVPGDIPLVLDYLQVDRQKLNLDAALNTPAQVDALAKKMAESGRFEEIVLGELKLDGGSVKFPMTAKVSTVRLEQETKTDTENKEKPKK
jgi:hypothetical protein